MSRTHGPASLARWSVTTSATIVTCSWLTNYAGPPSSPTQSMVRTRVIAKILLRISMSYLSHTSSSCSNSFKLRGAKGIPSPAALRMGTRVLYRRHTTHHSAARSSTSSSLCCAWASLISSWTAHNTTPSTPRADCGMRLVPCLLSVLAPVLS